MALDTLLLLLSYKFLIQWPLATIASPHYSVGIVTEENIPNLHNFEQASFRASIQNKPPPKLCFPLEASRRGYKVLIYICILGQLQKETSI